MKPVRCKFQINEVRRSGGQERIFANAISTNRGADVAEDRSFTKYTPQGSLEFVCQNPALIGTFNPDDLFYLDLVPIPKTE